MECTDIESSDEREEGEIFEDDLEEISDGSIAPSPKTGKSNSPEENSRAISLSSVSDLEIMECTTVYKSVPKYPRREVRKRKRSFRRHYRRSSDSSSENEESIKRKKLLKDAIKTDHDKMHNNSLRTRLKKMVENSTSPHNPASLTNCDSVKDNVTSFETSTISNDVEIETNKECIETDRPPCLAVDGDDELIQLRLEALKTAVINKFQRKKKKIKLDNPGESNVLEINKENSSDNVNTQSCTSENINCREEISERNAVVNNSSPNSALNSEEEVDEDILRAVLLASMSKKITNKVSSPIPKKNHHVNISTIPQQKQVIKSQAANKPNIDIPKIQPIIISINNPDSDSDDTFNDLDCTEKVKDENMTEQKKIEMKIDNFLKQQRAEVEAKSTATTVSKTSHVGNTENKKNVEGNDAYKLLPESKQLEYEKLIQKLNSAEIKNKPKRLSGRLSDNKLQKNKNPLRTTESNSSSIPSNLAQTLQKKLRLVQNQVNGRLQEKGKYNELTPLLKRLSQVNLEQKKHELRIKNLMKQLNDARVKSIKLQKVFDEIMQEFIKKKEGIDSKTKVVSAPQPQVKVKATPSIANSLQKKKISLQKLNQPAPPKKQLSNSRDSLVQCKVVLDKYPGDVNGPNDIRKVAKVETSDVPKHSSPLNFLESKTKAVSVSQPRVEIDPAPSIANSFAEKNINLKRANEPAPLKKIPNTVGSSVQCKVILEKCPDNLDNPNDIEFRIATKAEMNDVPKYISPLGNMESKNNRILNPMEILCPFEMDGLCRDKDCVYNHCS